LLPKVDKAVERLLIRLEQGQFEGVQADLEALLRRHPHYHTTNFAMGVYRGIVLQDPASALPFFQKAVSIFPPLAEAHYNLGSSYMKLARIAEAVASFRNAIRYSQDDGPIANKAREQIQALERIVKDTSSFPTLEACIESRKRFDLAFGDLRARRYQAAADGFRQVLAQTPDHVQSHGNLALAYAGLGKTALALEHLDKALALDPTYGPAIQNRKIVAALKEGEPQPPLVMQETEYYRERLEAEKPPTRIGLWQPLTRPTPG
jgi:tetratricopeptide (TPR) repeat protein